MTQKTKDFFLFGKINKKTTTIIDLNDSFFFIDLDNGNQKKRN
jgi:hypothetical protein